MRPHCNNSGSLPPTPQAHDDVRHVLEEIPVCPTGAFTIYNNMLPRMSEARLPQAVASYLESLAPTQRVSDFVSRMPFIIPIRAAPSGCIGDADLSTRQRADTAVGEQSWETWHRLGRDAVGCGTTRHDSEGRPLALPRDSFTQCVNYGISDSQSCHKCMCCGTPLARGYRSYTSNGPQACQSCLRRSIFRRAVSPSRGQHRFRMVLQCEGHGMQRPDPVR